MTHPIQDVFKTSIFTDVSENCMKRQTQVGCQKRRKKKVIYIAIEKGLIQWNAQFWQFGFPTVPVHLFYRNLDPKS